MNKKILTLVISLLSLQISEIYCQSGADSIGRIILSKSLSDKNLHNLLNYNRPIIKDSTTAVAVAEPILFGIYGKENILNQKPYHIYHVDNYWIISGSFPKGYSGLGGRFLIVLNDRDCKVMRITHGK